MEFFKIYVCYTNIQIMIIYLIYIYNVRFKFVLCAEIPLYYHLKLNFGLIFFCYFEIFYLFLSGTSQILA